MCWLSLVAQKKVLCQLSTCASLVLSQELAHSPHLSQLSHRRPTATPGARPAHTLLQNAFRSLPGPLSALPRPGTPPSPAKLQDSPSSSKITVPQGFHEKAITLTNENFTPTFPFCCISLHRFPSCANCNISVEHEHALRSESFTAAFRGLPMR